MEAGPLTDNCLEPFAVQLRCVGGVRTAYPVFSETGSTPGKHVFSVMTHAPVEGEIVIAKLERHPHSSQSFLPLKAGRWLVFVAPTRDDGTPDIDAAKAFLAGPEDAICFRRNVWHAGLMALDQPAEMAMMMWRAENGEDAVLYDLPSPVTVRIRQSAADVPPRQ